MGKSKHSTAARSRGQQLEFERRRLLATVEGLRVFTRESGHLVPTGLDAEILSEVSQELQVLLHQQERTTLGPDEIGRRDQLCGLADLLRARPNWTKGRAYERVCEIAQDLGFGSTTADIESLGNDLQRHAKKLERAIREDRVYRKVLYNRARQGLSEKIGAWDFGNDNYDHSDQPQLPTAHIEQYIEGYIKTFF